MHSCWAKLSQYFRQLLFFSFVSSFPWHVPWNRHSIYVVVSFRTRELLPLDRYFRILCVFTKTTKFYHKNSSHLSSFQYCSILWHFKGTSALHRDAVWEWRGNCAHSRMRSSSTSQSRMALHRSELLPQCNTSATWGNAVCLRYGSIWSWS